MNNSTGAHKRTISLALTGMCLLFAMAYYQMPLFYANQNTYFLHGLARAGYGFLAEDWLAQQADAVPVFSGIVYLVQTTGCHGLFYALQGILVLIYALSVYCLVAHAGGSVVRQHNQLVFWGLLTLVHAPWVLNVLSFLWPGLRPIVGQFQLFSKLFTDGLAEQCVLGPYLQPSVFGVFLITSVAFFVYKRYAAAVLCAVFAATIHTSLVPHAVLLIAAYMTVLLIENRVKQAIVVGLLAVVLILPILVYIGHNFILSDSPEIRAAGQRISVEYRQPHHAKIGVWFTWQSGVQLFIILTGLLLSWKSRPLFIVLCFCAIIATVLTLVQILSGSRSLALVFPWRTSIWLIPVCSGLIIARLTVLIARIIELVPSSKARQILTASAAMSGMVLLIGTSVLGVQATISGAIAPPNVGTVISCARMNARPRQTYLVPLTFQQFRLASGVPVFVDWKSHPYRNTEIVEWYQRVQLVKSFYQSGSHAEAEAHLSRIREQAYISHIIMERKNAAVFHIRGARFIMQDDRYILYALE